MTILHYSEPGSGGVKRHVVDLLRNLDAARDRYVLAYSRIRVDKTYDSELESLAAKHIALVEVPTSGRLAPWADLKSGWRLLGLLLRERPDVLHLHSSKSGGIGRLVAAVCSPSTKVIYAPHAMACFRSKAFSVIEKLLAPLHDLLLAVSRSEREDFYRWGIEISRCRSSSIIMGLAPVSSHGRRKDADGRFEVVTCGRICYQKNALLFFELALAAIAKHPIWRFRWIGDYGDDAEAEAVRALLKSAGCPSQIEVTGWLDDPLPLIAQGSVFCMFSRYESFGYVTAEAMAVGCPVLACDATGTRDLVIDGVTGLVARPSAEAALTDLEQMAADEALLQRLGGAARKMIAEEHSFARMSRSVADIYDGLRGHVAPAVI